MLTNNIHNPTKIKKLKNNNLFPIINGFMNNCCEREKLYFYPIG